MLHEQGGKNTPTRVSVRSVIWYAFPYSFVKSSMKSAYKEILVSFGYERDKYHNAPGYPFWKLSEILAIIENTDPRT